MINVINNCIALLKGKRQIFHSEDDFKFSFALVLAEELGDGFDIRLEKHDFINMKSRDGQVKKNLKIFIDITILDKEKKLLYPIELKYKTKKFEYLDNEYEKYELTNQRAYPKSRFSFRKDIYRLEQLLMNNFYEKGYFIVLTNDLKYKDDKSIGNTLDKDYSFHHNSILCKVDNGWNYTNSNTDNNWTKTGDFFYKLDLLNNYKVKWEDYSSISNEKFFMSIHEITRESI